MNSNSPDSKNENDLTVIVLTIYLVADAFLVTPLIILGLLKYQSPDIATWIIMLYCVWFSCAICIAELIIKGGLANGIQVTLSWLIFLGIVFFCYFGTIISISNFFEISDIDIFYWFRIASTIIVIQFIKCLLISFFRTLLDI